MNGKLIVIMIGISAVAMNEDITLKCYGYASDKDEQKPYFALDFGIPSKDITVYTCSYSCKCKNEEHEEEIINMKEKTDLSAQEQFNFKCHEDKENLCKNYLQSGIVEQIKSLEPKKQEAKKKRMITGIKIGKPENGTESQKVQNEERIKRLNELGAVRDTYLKNLIPGLII